MSFPLPFGIRTLNPVFAHHWAGPYVGTTEAEAKAAANAFIPVGVRLKGMEVVLYIGGVPKKYWYLNGTTDGDLVPFSSESATAETDPTVPSHVKAITSTQISNWDNVYSWYNGNPLSSYLTSALAASTYIPLAQKGAANGVVPLNASSKIDEVYFPDSILGQVEYMGTWNANTNTPTLPTPATSNKGHYYIATTSGTQFGIDFNVGDWVISDGSSWSKVDNTDAIPSFNGRTGPITLSSLDVTTALGYTPINPNGTILQYFRGNGSLATFPTAVSTFTNDAGYLTTTTGDARYSLQGHTHTFASLTAKPTDIGGYGITDAYTKTEINNFFAGSVAITGYNKSLWDTSYGWGNHAGLYPTYNGTGATGTWSISISGNAATVTNGVYTTGSYANPTWITSLAWSKITSAPSFITLTSLSAGTGINYNNITGVISSTITQYTDALARASISLTTTGANGSATYNNLTGVLNIPTYTLSGLGGEPAIASGTTAQYLRGDKTWQDFTTAARASFSAGTGITITSGTIATTITQYTDALARAALSFAAGSGAYNSTTGVITIPTNTNQLTNGAGFLSSVSLTTNVTGTLPVANGGTGTTTIAGIQSALGLGSYAYRSSGLAELSGATFTGAISGTSGNFSGGLTSATTFTLKPHLFYNGNGTNDIFASTTGNGAGSGNFALVNTVGDANTAILGSSTGFFRIGTTAQTAASADRFVLNLSTGAATFSNNVTTSGYFNLSSPSTSFGAGTNNSAWAEINTGTAFNVRIAGGDRFIVNSSGNVGIGTTSPSARLHVVANGEVMRLQTTASVGNNYMYFANNSGNMGYLGYGSANNHILLVNELSGGDIAFYTGGFDRFRIASTGAATFSSNVTVGGLLIGNDRLYLPGNQPVSNWVSASLTAGYSSTNSYGWVNGANNLVLGTDGVERMRITNTGAATFSSSVTGLSFLSSGAGSFGSTTAISSAVLSLQESASLSAAIAMKNRNSTRQYAIAVDAASVDDGAFAIIDQTAGAARFTIASTGAANFSNQVTATQFNGSGAGLTGVPWASIAGAPSFLTTAVTSATGTANQITVSASTGAVTFSLPSAVTISGNMTAAGFFESSDIRLKDVIKEMTSFTGINTIIYNWKDKRDHLFHIGYSAQQVEEILPYAVSESNGYKTVDYNQVHTFKIMLLEDRILKLEEELKQYKNGL